MTKKDYVMLATRLNELYLDIGFSLFFDQFMSRLCADLKQDNPNFDSAKFREKVYHG